MSVILDTKALRETADQCRKNGPKPELAFDEYVIKPLKKVFADTNIPNFEKMLENAEKTRKKTVEPITASFDKLAKSLEEMADSSDKFAGK